MKKFFNHIIAFIFLLVISAQAEAFVKNEPIPDSIFVDKLLSKANTLTYDHTDSALEVARKALHYAIKINYKKGEAFAYNTIGNVYYIKGSYENALNNYFEAKNRFVHLNNSNRVAWAENNIGLIYIAEDDFEKSIAHFSKLITSEESTKDSMLLANLYFNLGLSYDLKKDHLQAIPILEKAIDISTSIGFDRIKVMSLNRMAEAYLKMDKLEEAHENYVAALNDTSYESNWEKSFSNTGLAILYLKRENYDEAISFANAGLRYAQKVEAKWDAMRSSEVLANAYAANENYGNAYKYHQLFKAYSDSVRDESKDEELNLLRLEQKELENNRLMQESIISKQKAEITRQWMIGIATVSVLITLMLIYYSRNNKVISKLNHNLLKKNADIARQKEQLIKQNESLEQINSSKNKLFSIISHDFKSPLSSLIGTLELTQQGNISQEENKELLRHLHIKVLQVSQMLNNLLYWANSQQMGIRTHKKDVNIPDVVKEVLAIARYMAVEKSITLEHQNIHPCMVHADPDHLRIIVQNVLTNALKFTPVNGKITISYHCDELENQVIIEDSGIGIAPDKLEKLTRITGSDISAHGTNNEAGTGIGLSLVKNFIAENDGDLLIESEIKKGTKVTISLPAVDQDHRSLVQENLEIYRNKVR